MQLGIPVRIQNVASKFLCCFLLRGLRINYKLLA
jgi:hypothetical protein